MSYFNHAFNKVFVGTSGFVTDPGTHSSAITKGQFTFVDPTSWSVPADLDPSTTLACPLVLVSGSIYSNDKIGKFHGGYKESTKSKIINPKYVTKFYRVDPCTPQNMTISVGTTPYTTDEGEDLVCNIPGSVTQKDFMCGETYYLRLDLKGSPVLRFLTRNSYYTADAYTGCCPAGALEPTPVDPTTVYIEWAKNFMRSPLIAPFIEIEIFDTTGASIGSYNQAEFDAAVNAGTLTWDTYTAVTGAEGQTAGMYITGAYVDTRFGDCTFYPNDSLIAFLEPVTILASEVDYNGLPCEFASLCVANVCAPVQGIGFGETVVRELILSESYGQNWFNTGSDLRIREITQGYDVTDTISRTSSYTRYFLQHSVPRFNNPSGTFDNDQYLLEIITEESVVADLDVTGASSNTAAAGDLPAFSTIAVASTAGLEPGMVVTKTSGTGTISAGAYILEVVSATSFTITLGTATSPVTVALDATTVLSATSATLSAFEDFVNSWIENAQGAACVQMETMSCPAACTVPEPA